MAHDLKPDSIDAARYMALDHVPVTPQAQALSAAFAARILETGERRQNKRRGKHQTAFERAAGAFAADLLLAGQTPGRYSHRSAFKASFKGDRVSFNTFMQLRDGSLSAQLVEWHPTKWFSEEVGFGARRGKARRLRATATFFELALAHGITPGTVSDHFKLYPKSIEPLVLKASSERIGGRKVRGGRMLIPDNETTQRLRADVDELNQFTRAQDIQGGIHVGYYRGFNQGDLPSFRWNKGGRLTSVGEGNYQTLKKEQRLAMTMNGEPVVEIDVRASQLTILHAVKGIPFDPSIDPYDIPALYRDGVPRSVSRAVAKQWVTMSLGHTRFHTRWPPDKATEFREKHGIELSKVFPLKQVQAAVLDHLPVMKDWPGSSVTCFDLMFFESEAVIGTMLTLMRDYGVPSLGVHDSLIVPASAAELAATVLRMHYFTVCEADAYLDVRRSAALMTTMPAALPT